MGTNTRPIKHGTPYGWQRGCRCDDCHEALLAKSRADRVRERERYRLRHGMTRRKYQTQPWTAEHLELLASETLTCQQIADKTGHTLDAVEGMRQRSGLGRKQRGLIVARPRAEREARATREKRQRVPLPALERGARIQHLRSGRVYRVIGKPIDGIVQITAATEFGTIYRVPVDILEQRYEGERQ